MSKDLNALIQGFAHFKERYTDQNRVEFERLVELGQQPTILVIACCDARVDPAIITESDAGDMLVVRNIANLVPPYSEAGEYVAIQAAVELAISYLKVSDIIVMGHSRCMGVATLVNRMKDDTDPQHPLEQWTQIAEPAAREVFDSMPDASLEDLTCACSRKAVGVSLKNLQDYPWVADALNRQAVKLHGWYFNLAERELLALDDSGGWTPLC